MANRILILQSEPKSAQVLEDFFYWRGDKTWKTGDPVLATSLLRSSVPGLVFVDLHVQGNWLDFLATIRQKYPNTRVIVTSRYPDLRREFMAKEQGVTVFLREPFTPEWIERSLERLEKADRGEEPARIETGILPRVRVPMRWKITFPYTVLALLFALAAAYLVSRFVLDSIHERFTNQLVDAGRLSADWMVQQENSLLKTLRQVSNTQGVADAVSGSDANILRNLALPILINQAAGDVEILNLQGNSVLSLRRKPGGGLQDYEATMGSSQFGGLPFVQAVLKGQVDQGRDKYAGVAQVGEDSYFFVSGPIFDLQDRRVGAVLVGESLVNLVQANRQATMAQVTLYSLDGSVMATTLLIPGAIQPVLTEQVQEVLKRQDESSPIRDLAVAVDSRLGSLAASPAIAPVRQVLVASQSYTEIIGPWEARGGQDLGLIGVSLAESSLVAPTLMTRVKAFILVAVAFIGVIVIGLVLSRQVTLPLSRVVEASQKVAQGNLEVKVPAQGNDEVAVVAHAFNYMVSGLQEGFIYRDLLGRTVSPEVREALRTSFESGDLRLEGQNTVATILMSDIRGFTMLAERAEPTTILTWLNEYFSELVPVIASFGGVIDKFEGDAMLAFFGILPKILPPEESSLHGCQAAMEMMAVVERINQRRKERHEPQLLTGIGINTGSLIAGGLGTADRLNYTVIGDTVNTTQRIQTMTRKFSEGGVVISESTAQALKGRRGDFRIEPLGEHSFQGKTEQLWLYRLYPAQTYVQEKKVIG